MRRQFAGCLDRLALLAEIKYGLHVCAQCDTTENLQVDHVVALARGGVNGRDNYQVLCGFCNARKGAR